MGEPDTTGVIRTTLPVLVHENQWWRVWFDEVELPAGITGRHMRLTTSVSKPGAVALVRDTAGPVPETLLVRQWRYAQQRWMWELPRGFADDSDEDHRHTVAREVGEETGLEVLTCEHLGDLCTDSSIIAGTVACYLVTVRRDAAPPPTALESRWIPDPELRELLRTGAIQDAYTLSALALHSAHDPRP